MQQLMLSYGQNPGIDPSTLSGRVLDLDATKGVTLVSGKVDIWADQSGQNHHFTALTASNRLGYGTDAYGKTVVQFDGIQTYLKRFPDNLGISTYPFSVVLISDAGNLFSFGINTVTNVYYVSSPGGFIVRNTTQYINTVGSTGVQTGIVEFTNDTYRDVINGHGSTSNTASVTYHPSINNCLIGVPRDTSPFGWSNGDAYRIIVFNRVLTTEEKEGIIQYGRVNYKSE